MISSRASRSAIQSPMLEGRRGRDGRMRVGGTKREDKRGREVTSSLHNCVTLSGNHCPGRARTDTFRKNSRQTGFPLCVYARSRLHASVTHTRSSTHARARRTRGGTAATVATTRIKGLSLHIVTYIVT